MEWFFDMISDEFGDETFGPYDTEAEARESIDRVKQEAIKLNDEIERRFIGPYKKVEE
jgi:hypothetical protein